MPRTEEEWRGVSNAFNSTWKFPNCLESMDRKHVKIPAPKNSSCLFFNSKGTSSIALFTDVDGHYNII
jgi:hypothetical protein